MVSGELLNMRIKGHEMKKITFNFKGDDKIVFVNLYGKNFLDDLRISEIDNFDQRDFLAKHEEKSFWVGRGLGTEGNLQISSVEIDGNDKNMLWDNFESDHVYVFDGDPSKREDQDAFEKIYGVRNEKVLIGVSGTNIDISEDADWFSDADKYMFATIEIVSNLDARGSVTIEVEANWKPADFNIIFISVDTGGLWGESFTQEVFRITGLEDEPIGIEYKGKVHFIENEYMGGNNEWYYLENLDGKWVESLEIEGLFNVRM